MDRTTRTVVKFLAIIAATLVCIALAYFLVSNIFGGQLANASNGITLSAWKEKYLNVVIMAGALTGVCSLIWFILSNFIFKVEYPYGGGKRTVWATLALIALVISIAVPMFYPARVAIQLNAPVVAIFAVLFALVNYWLITIFATPLAFKYTPVGAKLFLSPSRK